MIILNNFLHAQEKVETKKSMTTLYSLNDFLDTKRSEGTKKTAGRSIRDFLHVVYPDLKKEDVNACSIRYLEEHTDHFSQIVRYIQAKSYKAPLTVIHDVNNIRYWLKWNNIELSVAECAKLKNILPRPVVITEDETLTTEKIRTILNHSDVLMRAFILTLCSSGMRADELINIQFEDMRDDGCRRFHIPASRMKARKPHDYRYSSEAHEAILEWLKVRDTYMAQADVKVQRCLPGRNVHAKGKEYIFPFSYTLFNEKLHNVLSSAQMLRKDEASGHYTIGFQAFRRWYDSTIKLHMSVNLANELVGHDEGLSSNYRRYPQEMLDKAYLEVEQYLRIFAPEDYADLKNEFARMLHEQEVTTARLTAEVLKQREDIAILTMKMKNSDRW